MRLSSYNFYKNRILSPDDDDSDDDLDEILLIV